MTPDSTTASGGRSSHATRFSRTAASSYSRSNRAIAYCTRRSLSTTTDSSSIGNARLRDMSLNAGASRATRHESVFLQLRAPTRLSLRQHMRKDSAPWGRSRTTVVRPKFTVERQLAAIPPHHRQRNREAQPVPRMDDDGRAVDLAERLDALCLCSGAIRSRCRFVGWPSRLLLHEAETSTRPQPR